MYCCKAILWHDIDHIVGTRKMLFFGRIRLFKIKRRYPTVEIVLFMMLKDLVVLMVSGGCDKDVGTENRG